MGEACSKSVGLSNVRACYAAPVDWRSFFFTNEWLVSRPLRKLRRKKIAEVRDASVCKIVGRIQPLDAPLTAPLTGRPCVYFAVLVQEWVADSWWSRSQGTWKELIHEEKSCDFLVSDGSGAARVRLAELPRLYLRDVTFASPVEVSHPRLETFLMQHYEASAPQRDLHYRETVLCPDEEIAVVGRPSFEADPGSGSASYREAPMRAVFADSEEVTLLLTDERSHFK
jgi:hypothetical protein